MVDMKEILEGTNKYFSVIVIILYVSRNKWYPLFEYIIMSKILKKVPSANNHPGLIKLREFYLDVNSKEIEGHASKSKMMRDCMRIIITTLEEDCKSFIADSINYSLEPIMLQNEIQTLLLSMSSKCNTAIKKHYLKQGLNYDDTNIIIKRINKSRKTSRDIISQQVEVIFSTGYHRDNNSILVAAITAISISTAWLLESIYNDFEEMNGVFDKYKYNYELDKHINVLIDKK